MAPLLGWRLVLSILSLASVSSGTGLEVEVERRCMKFPFFNGVFKDFRCTNPKQIARQIALEASWRADRWEMCRLTMSSICLGLLAYSAILRGPYFRALGIQMVPESWDGLVTSVPSGHLGLKAGGIMRAPCSTSRLHRALLGCGAQANDVPLGSSAFQQSGQVGLRTLPEPFVDRSMMLCEASSVVKEAIMPMRGSPPATTGFHLRHPGYVEMTLAGKYHSDSHVRV